MSSDDSSFNMIKTCLSRDISSVSFVGKAWIIDLESMQMFSLCTFSVKKIKYVIKEDAIYSLYECPAGKHDSWHKCVPEIRDLYVELSDKMVENILLK